MTNINTVFLVGHLTQDIELAFTSGGTAIGKTSIAVNRSRKNGDKWVDEVSFFNVSVWGKTAENLQNYLKKGAKIALKGFLKQERWQDKNDGQNKSKISIIADQIELCGEKDNQGSSNSGKANNASTQNQQVNSPEGFPEDIPF